MALFHRLTEWLDFYRTIKVLKQMTLEQKSSAGILNLKEYTEYQWLKGSIRFVVKEYKDGTTYYHVATSKKSLLFEATDRGWLRGTSGRMEAGMCPDVLIMKMLS